MHCRQVAVSRYNSRRIKMHEKYSYRIIWSEEDQEYVGLCTELPSLSWLSDNQTEAFKGIMKLAASVIKDMEKEGEPIPEPISTKEYSGKFVVRVPPEVHRKLVMEAMGAHVSLNRYLLILFSSRLGI